MEHNPGQMAEGIAELAEELATELVALAAQRDDIDKRIATTIATIEALRNAHQQLLTHAATGGHDLDIQLVIPPATQALLQLAQLETDNSVCVPGMHRRRMEPE